MKDKKKVGLVKRIAAGVYALMLVVGCFSSSLFYASDYIFTTDNSNFVLSDVLPLDDYPEYIVYYENPWGFYCILGKNKSDFSCGSVSSGTLTVSCSQGVVYRSSDGLDWVKQSGSAAFNIYADKTTGYKICYSTMDLYSSEGILVCSSSTSSSGGSYNTSLGYLQNVKRHSLYLENDAFAPVDETMKYQFTFDSTTTTGLDITDGNWSVRHYMQVEVKNAKKDYETVEIYDKIQMGEYPASSCKVGYMFKDTVEQLHEESEFDGLSWWESNALGYITYYNDYFQLVRTNEDGSVEYGGFVKVWQDEYNVNHSATLGEDESQDNTGYNDNIVPGSHGSGSTYDEAEHDSNENASNSANDSDDMLDSLDDMVSTVMAVPQIFAKLFSFLPDWCLNLFGASVGLAGIILVWKVARG